MPARTEDWCLFVAGGVTVLGGFWAHSPEAVTLGSIAVGTVLVTVLQIWGRG